MATLDMAVANEWRAPIFVMGRSKLTVDITLFTQDMITRIKVECSVEGITELIQVPSRQVLEF